MVVILSAIKIPSDRLGGGGPVAAMPHGIAATGSGPRR